MLSLPLPVRIFLCTQPADLRCSFDGLALLVRQHLGHDPQSGHLFVFRNKQADRVKLLYWDRDGFAIWYTRPEEGTFPFPTTGPASPAWPPLSRAGRITPSLQQTGAGFASVERVADEERDGP